MIVPAIHPSDPGDRPHVEFRGWTVKLRGREQLRWVDFDIPKGRIVALVGPTGSGKSALISSINRMLALEPDFEHSGQVLLAGDPVWGREVDDLLVRRRTGTVFRDGTTLPGTVWENVAFPLRLDGERRSGVLDAAVESALRSVSAWEMLRDRLHKSAASLPAGPRQLVNLARAVVGSPEILLLDEPCGDLDPVSTEMVEQALVDLSGSRTVVLSTHNLAQASRLPHRVAFFLEGHLEEYGPTDRMFQRPIRRSTEDYLSGRFG
ncbi:MAG: phosphate transporter ATP-binding protein [Fibrobacterota bacterium]|jgi:phosphate transport system ATP-binding protein